MLWKCVLFRFVFAPMDWGNTTLACASSSPSSSPFTPPSPNDFWWLDGAHISNNANTNSEQRDRETERESEAFIALASTPSHSLPVCAIRIIVPVCCISTRVLMLIGVAKEYIVIRFAVFFRFHTRTSHSYSHTHIVAHNSLSHSPFRINIYFE